MELIYHNGQFRFYLVFTAADMSGAVKDPEKKTVLESGLAGSRKSPAAPARMQVIRENASGNTVVLMDYTFPAQLLPEVRVKEEGKLEEDVLTFSLHLEVHHVSGMVQGEFVEDETYEVRNPFDGLKGTDDSGSDGGQSVHSDPEPAAADNREEAGRGLQCAVTDIIRKTRFAAAPRHLEHVPKQTYPPVDGKQGPYGHPSIRTLPPIPRRKHAGVSDS